ncbi:MotA/TolQ/ExbB proton channel family protein [Mesobacterium pallidum]|uniref:MotA/TolQ/ExbB proton channel family protein n=1 Tax=Mesobacterium pallidum TaxID=2872037 RepID=UPI001EE21EF0|nr:MotA/TolQ/ExbB proton channel family protein [Mesobacterium pallidum]
MPWTEISDFLTRGGPAMWAIAALSVLTLALILWKIWRLSLMGAWGGARAEAAVTAWVAGDRDGARAALARARGLRARAVRAAIDARQSLPEDKAREETARAGRAILLGTRTGLRALELIATIAPLIGLLGTVLGMIAAFQALQEAGNRADPSALAGGIWEALLTTAAGMTVAIPASVALSWFEAVVERVQADMEDAATRIFTAPDPGDGDV